MRRIIRLTESDLTRIVKRVILEQEVVMLVEEKKSFLTVFPKVSILTDKHEMGYSPIDGKDNTNIIILSKRDEKGNEMQDTKFSYRVSGTYKFIDFDIILKEVSRSRGGGYVDMYVKPKNGLVAKTMKTLMPEEFITSDGFLMIRIELDKLNAGLRKLHKNKGLNAKIEAGYGVIINLKLI